MINKTLDIKRILFVAVISVFTFFIMLFCKNTAKAEDTPFEVFALANTGVEETKIYCRNIEGENVLILPSSVNPEKVQLYVNGQKKIYIEGALKKGVLTSGIAVNLNKFCANGNYVLKFYYGRKSMTVHFVFLENVPAVFVVSDNPSENGREWVEESPDKKNKATGRMVMIKENGETVYNGALTQIKGRGNSTWKEVKKPYQIKTEIKTDLLETGNSENASKTWVLLANYLDPSLLNNSFALNLGKEMGMKTNIENTYVDLYYDGEYRGSYLLSEKVEVGSGRVDIESLEDKNTAANESIVIEDLPINTDTTASGAFYTYCDGMTSPEDITGGYLIEMDYKDRAEEEICYFRTSRGQYVVVKSPEYASKEEMDYIASLYQEYEDAVYNGGINPVTGKAYSDYVDAESIACYYIVNELSKSRDFFGSSAYLYKNAGEDRMYMGPLWDYDLGFGKSRYENNEEEPVQGMSVYREEMGIKLFQIKDFKMLINDLYSSKFYPYLTEYFKDAESGNYSVKEYVSVSAKYNALMWHSDKDWETEAGKFESFITQRAEYLKTLFNYYAENEETAEILFADVPSGLWFYDCIKDIKQLGYMKGVNENYFDPYANVKRSELAQIIFNISGETAPQFCQKFSDVHNTDWFKDAVLWATNKNLLHDAEGDCFNPGQYVTREYVAVALYRYYGSPDTDGILSESFTDKESISEYATDAVLWATENGILLGDDNGCLNPLGYITRAEFAAMLVRVSNLNEN